MLNVDEASRSISLAGFYHLVKMLDGHICDENQYLFQEKLLLIASYSCTVLKNYCESKSDIYFLLIRINLFKLEEHIIACLTLLVGKLCNYDDIQDIGT